MGVPGRMQGYGYFLLLIGMLLPWLWLQMSLGVSADAAWLTGAAEHFLAGQRMTEAYYDSNPPMCYIIFVPVVLLMKLGLPLWTALNIFTLALMAACLCLSMRILRFFPDMGPVRYWGVLSAWMLGVSLLSYHEFGQKDHFIALGLFPFLLLQFALTSGKKLPKALVIMTLLIGVPCLLIKPHYGLLPVMALAHRAWTQRRLSVCFDVDFLALAAGVLLYGAAIAIWFPDFVTEVLPNSVQFYIAQVFLPVFGASFGLLLLSGCLLVLSLVSAEKDFAGALAVFLNVMSTGAAFVFLIQFKGFSVHILPVISLLAPASFMTISLLFPNIFKQFSGHITAAIMILIIGAGYLFIALGSTYPTHRAYAVSPLALLLQSKASGSSFFMQANSTNIVVPVSVYTGIPMASRFSLMWFLPGLASEDQSEAKEVFTQMVAEDLQKFRPALIALYADPAPEEDFLEIFGNVAAFQEEWKNYRKEGQFTLDYRDYFAGNVVDRYRPIIYDIYIRK